MSVRRALVGAALCASALMLVGCAGSATAEPAVRDTGGAIVAAGDSDVFSLQVGDCFVEPDIDSVSDVEVVPCDDGFDLQIYNAFAQPGAEYSTDDTLKAQADAGCEPAFDAAIGIAFSDSVLEYRSLVPSEISWNHGDRTILCAVYDPAGASTGTLLGSAR
ncbi:septum formation family protein [Microbacteriaceae bacterium VKM Ac-2854]|nr:septum formation family protein [Microbacteriaceae bacterium VKM Ac-2854]